MRRVANRIERASRFAEEAQAAYFANLSDEELNAYIRAAYRGSREAFRAKWRADGIAEDKIASCEASVFGPPGEADRQDTR